MVPSKVEITLRKADQVSWGKLEDPNYKPEPDPTDDSENTEAMQAEWDIADDDISDDDEWAYDTRENKEQKIEKFEGPQQRPNEEIEERKRKEVEEEMKRATEERQRAEEEKKKLEEQRRMEEAGEYDDMPDLE